MSADTLGQETMTPEVLTVEPVNAGTAGTDVSAEAGFVAVLRDRVRVTGPTVRPALDRRSTPGTTRAARRIAAVRETDVLALVGGALSAAALTWMLFTRFAPFSGKVGWVVVGWLIFVGVYGLLVSMDETRQAVKDRLATAIIHSLAALMCTVLVFVIGYVLARGFSAMVHANFYLQDLGVTGPLDPLTVGGIKHGIVGTLIEITIALLITVPLGLTCAVFMSEFPGPFARIVRTVVEAMTALPSIVAGLFIYTTWILTFGFPKSGLAAGLALSLMMFPIVIRAADVVLRLVPGSLTEASLALGASRWRTVLFVTLPTARSGLATAVILGTARGIGETSPVLLTAGYGTNLNLNPGSGPMVSLPLLAYQLRTSPQPTMIARSFGAAATLMVIVLVLFVVARWLGGRGPGVLSPAQMRRRVRESAQDAERFVTRMQHRQDTPPVLLKAEPAAEPPAPEPTRAAAAKPTVPAPVVRPVPKPDPPNRQEPIVATPPPTRAPRSATSWAPLDDEYTPPAPVEPPAPPAIPAALLAWAPPDELPSREEPAVQKIDPVEDPAHLGGDQ